MFLTGMKFMQKDVNSSKVFLDTNILVYLYTDQDEAKKEVFAQLLEPLEQEQVFVSTHVLGELMHVLGWKFKLDHAYITSVIDHVESIFTVVDTQFKWYRTALKIAENTGYTIFDSLVIASGLYSDCTVLYTEDLTHKRLIEHDGYKIRITNPLK